MQCRVCWLTIFMCAVMLQRGEAQPIIDTAWVRTAQQLGLYDLRCCTIGNASSTLLAVNRGPLENDVATIVEIDIERGIVVDSLTTPHIGPVLDIVMADSADVFCTVEASQRILVWSWKQRRLLLEILDEPYSWEPQVAISPDGSLLFNATTGRMYELHGGRRIWESYSGTVKATPRFTANGNMLICSQGMYVHFVTLFDARSGDVLDRFQPSRSTWISACAVSNDGRYVAVVDGGSPQSESSFIIHDRSTGSVVMDTTHSSAHIRSVSFTPDGKGFITDVWPLSDAAPTHYFQFGSWQPLSSFSFSSPIQTRDWRYAAGCTESTMWLSHYRNAPGSLPPPEYDETAPLTIAPNPAQDAITISGIPGGTALIDIRIVDERGASVSHDGRLSNHGIVHLDVSLLASGRYFLYGQRGHTQVFSASFVVLR